MLLYRHWASMLSSAYTETRTLTQVLRSFFYETYSSGVFSCICPPCCINRIAKRRAHNIVSPWYIVQIIYIKNVSNLTIGTKIWFRRDEKWMSPKLYPPLRQGGGIIERTISAECRTRLPFSSLRKVASTLGV